MKIEEAINTLSLFGCFDCKRYAEDLDCCYDNMDCWEAKDMAIEALEKQIPKKPTFSLHYFNSGLTGNVGHCPSCPEHATLMYNTPYCPHCGQAIDWSEE